MNIYYADLHVHIGRTLDHRPVKITAADSLTLAGALEECASRKGIQVLGIVDMASPPVIWEAEILLDGGDLALLPGGGYRYHDLVTLIPAVEVETGEGLGTASGAGSGVAPASAGGTAHWLVYFRELGQVKEFSRFLGHYVTNMTLSTQRCRLSARDIYRQARELGGIFVPAHAFTPHKSVFGNCVPRLEAIFGPEDAAAIPAIELGLSADSDLADCLPELWNKTFLSNSDAHSLPKIAREYNAFSLGGSNFEELLMAIRRERGRGVAANYGLDPKLGKYHRTRCLKCDGVVTGEPPQFTCQNCGSGEVVRGVLDRIAEIRVQDRPVHPPHRPPYVCQIPLAFLPGVGKRTIDRLLAEFGTEMAVLHQANREQLVEVVGPKTADLIIRAREGRLGISCGGGGTYGRIMPD